MMALQDRSKQLLMGVPQILSRKRTLLERERERFDRSIPFAFTAIGPLLIGLVLSSQEIH